MRDVHFTAEVETTVCTVVQVVTTGTVVQGFFDLENGGSTMLVLSRKSQESVVVSGTDGVRRLLKVTVLGIQGTNVKLGFEIGPEIPVHRSELCERIREAAGQTT